MSRARTERDEIAEAVARAEKARAARKAAPMVSVGGISIRPKALIQMHAAKHGGQDAKDGRHYAFFPEEDLKLMAAQGYMPEVDEGELVRNETDVLMWCDTAQYRETLAQAQASDIVRQREQVAKDKADAKASGVSTGLEVTITRPQGAGGVEE